MLLKDCATIKGGKRLPKGQTLQNVANDHPYIRVKDMQGRYVVLDSSYEYVPDSVFPSISRYTVETNDIILSIVGTVGLVALVDESLNNASLTENCVKLINIKNHLPEFIYYYLYSDKGQAQISEGVVGSTQPKFPLYNIEKLDVPDISMNEQQHIVDILGSIDAKIENNQEKVDLLLKNLRLQFIVRFTKQELTKSTALSYFITETIGGDWGKETAQGNYSERVVCLRGADIPEIASGKNGDPPTRYILPKNLLTKQLAPWEIIVEISGGSPTQSTGRCALITSEMLSNYSTPIICTNFCRAIRCKNPQFAAYVYSLLIAMYNNNLFFNYENGTTGIKNLDLSSILEKEYVYLPSEDELESFYIFTSKTYKQIEQHKTENNKLNELKQLYLKKFFG